MEKMYLTTSQTTAPLEQYDNFFRYLDVSKGTSKTYKNAIKKFIGFIGIETRPTREDILKYKEYLINNYKPNTVNIRLAAIKQFFKWLEYERIYPDITKNIKKIEVGEIDKNYPTLEEIKEIIKTIKNEYDKALFALLVTTGLRLHEVMNSNIEDIQELHGQKVLFVLGKGRNGKEEYVKISDTLYKLLKSVIKERKSGAIFLSTSNRNKGNRVTTRALYDRIKRIYKSAGIDEHKFTCHALRGSFSVIAMENGASIYEISKVLRHKNIHTTEVYLRSLDRAKNKTEYIVSDIIL